MSATALETVTAWLFTIAAALLLGKFIGWWLWLAWLTLGGAS